MKNLLDRYREREVTLFNHKLASVIAWGLSPNSPPSIKKPWIMPL
jgi:hypothetical protein